MRLYSARNQNVLSFKDYVKDMCKEHEIDLSLRPTDYIWCDNLRASGYFDGDNKELRVATKYCYSLEIFIHEFGHMTQWLEPNSIWYKNKFDHTKFDYWLDGVEVKNINAIIDEIREIELDCEKRTVKLIKKFDLPVKIDDYVRGANSYLLFHDHIKNTRKWSHPDNRPYENKAIRRAVPTTFLTNYPKYFKNVRQIYETQNI